MAVSDDEVRLVKYAVGGTALYNDWAPTKGAQYVGFMKTMRAALADLDGKKVKYEIAGTLWLQGESDASEKQAEHYKKNLTAFIKHMRTEYNTPEMPFYIARVREFWGKGAQAEMVRDAQEQVAKEMKAVSWFSTDDCGELILRGHFKSAGLIKIGKKFAKQAQEKQSR